MPPALVDRLAELGIPAKHVTRIGLGGATDGQIWRQAIQDGASLITKNEDFAALARSTADGPAVVWIRLGNATTAALWRALGPLWPEIEKALDNGERLIEID